MNLDYSKKLPTFSRTGSLASVRSFVKMGLLVLTVIFTLLPGSVHSEEVPAPLPAYPNGMIDITRRDYNGGNIDIYLNYTINGVPVGTSSFNISEGGTVLEPRGVDVHRLFRENGIQGILYKNALGLPEMGNIQEIRTAWDFKNLDVFEAGIAAGKTNMEAAYETPSARTFYKNGWGISEIDAPKGELPVAIFARVHTVELPPGGLAALRNQSIGPTQAEDGIKLRQFLEQENAKVQIIGSLGSGRRSYSSVNYRIISNPTRNAIGGAAPLGAIGDTVAGPLDQVVPGLGTGVSIGAVGAEVAREAGAGTYVLGYGRIMASAASQATILGLYVYGAGNIFKSHWDWMIGAEQRQAEMRRQESERIDTRFVPCD